MDEPAQLANEGWFNNRWRPAMAWLWFCVSGCDFILFPILNVAAAGSGMIPYHPWEPITLKGGGLFHVAMGAVVGVAVWQRTQEKMAIYSATGLAAGGGSVTTERTMERTSSVAAAAISPVKSDISSRAD